MATLVLAEYLGVHPRVVNGTSTGGSSYEVLAAAGPAISRQAAPASP